MAAAAATRSPFPCACEPSGSTGVSSSPVLMPWPWRIARSLTAHGGDAVAVVNLLEGYAGFMEGVLDGCGVRDRVGGVGVERLHHGSDASG